jgi:hypothetical protein
MLADLQGLFDCCIGPGVEGFVQLEPAVIGRHECLDARSREFEHPANVLRHDEVPGGPHDVRAQNCALVEGAIDVRSGGADRALGDAPLCARIVLRLDGGEPSYDVLRALKAGPEKVLGMEALGGNIQDTSPRAK